MTTRDEASPPNEPAATAEAARRPYRKPELRRLGSVREVTWGNTGSSIDNGFKGVPKGKM